MALPDIRLASCVWGKNNFVAKSRGFSPVKQAFWTNMWQVVRGRKQVLSQAQELIVWYSDGFQMNVVVVVWQSLAGNQLGMWVLYQIRQLSSGCCLCFVHFCFFCVWASLALACFLFYLILDCCRFRITDGRSKTMSSTLCVASGVLRFFLSTTYPLMLETHILSTNPYHIFCLPNKWNLS